MKTKIKVDEIIDMEHINTSISIKLGNTKDSLEFVKQIQPFIRERMPLRISVQKRLVGSADVLIEMGMNSNYKYGRQILIRDAFNIGYNGAGARGLMTFFEIFGADSSELRPLVLQSNEQLENKRLVVEIL